MELHYEYPYEGQQCNSGFLDSLRAAAPELKFPLLGRSGSSGQKQWVFPDLQFTCQRSVSGWTFSLIMGEDFTTSCSVEITTWRPVESIPSPSEYERVSTTADNVRYITSVDGPLYKYELTNPIQVEPGDIVGIEKSTTFCSNPANFDNIRSLNVSQSESTVLSYMRSTEETRFILDPDIVAPVTGIIPLLKPVYGQFNLTCVV